MKSNQMHKAILENMSEAVYVRDLDMNILYLNPASERLTGWSLQETLGRKCYEVFGDESLMCKNVCPVEKVISEELYIFHHQGKLKTRSGEERDIRVSISPFYDGETIIGAVVVMEDTTYLREVEQTHIKTPTAPETEVQQRQIVEEALRESEEMYKALVKTSPDAVTVTDLEGYITNVSQRTLEMHGFKSAEELLGRRAFEFIAPQDHERAMINLQKTLREGVTRNIEYILLKKDGTRFVGELNAALIKDVYGQPKAFIATTRNITERKQAEEALKESEEKFRGLAEQSPNMIFINKKGRVVYANKKCEEVMGYKREEFYSPDFDFLTLIAPEYIDLIKASFSRHTKGENILPYEYALVTKEGKRIETIITSKLIRYGGESAILGIVTDITERKRAEEALKRRLEQLASLNQASQAVTASLELDQVLAEIASLASEVAASDYASVVLVDEEGRLGRSVEYLPGVLDIEHRIRAEGFTGWVVRSRQAVVVDDIGEDGTVNPKPASGAQSPELVEGLCTANPLIVEAGVKSFVGLPLVAKDRLLGVLHLYSLRPGNFRAQLPLLTTFANQMALAIENARIYEEERKRVTQLQLIGGITQKIASILDLDELLHEVVHLVGDTFGYYYTGILLVKASSDELILRAISGPFETQIDRLRLKIGREGITGWVAHSGEPLLINNVSREPRYYFVEESKDTRSELAVPIKLKGEIIGVLDVQSVELDAFGEDDIFILQTLADQLAIAIENARLYTQAQARSRYLETLQQVNATLRSTLPLSQVLETVTEGAGEALNYVGSLIIIPDATGERLTLGAVWGSRFLDATVQLTGLDVASFSLPLTAKENPMARAYLSGELQAWSGEPEWIVVGIEPAVSSKLAPVIARAMGARGAACVPLPVSEKVVGVLVVLSPREQLSDEERIVLLGLADQAGLAIENARLYQETVRRLKETETLGAVTTALTRSLDLDQVLQSIVDSATQLIPASISGVIHFVDEAARKLIPQATSAPGGNVQKSMAMPIGEGIAGLVMQEKRLINVPNVEEDPRFLPLDTGTPKKSLLTAPLLIDRDCIGTLSLNSDQVDAFSADDERLLTTLAAQAAVAVRNARLHQEIQRRLEELIFLNRVGRTVTSSLDLEQVLTTVMEETAIMLGTEAGSILLLDEESNELVFEAAVGPRSEKIKGLRVPSGQGIAGWVVREGQRLLVPDVGEDPRFYPDIDGGTGFVTRSLLAVPLKVKGKVIGVIEAVNKTEGYFTQADVALLSAMAQWAAIAIENAQLFSQTRQRFEEMAALHDTSLDITARLEMPELLKSIVERAVGLLRADAGGVYLYDQEREALRLAIGYDYTEKYVGVTLKPGEGMAGKVFQTGEPLILDDYRTWEGRAAVFEADQPFTAALEVPLRWQERIIGVLAISADAQKRTFNQDEVWLATLFANQAAIAMENARLYEELQARMEELKRTQAQLIQSAKLAAIGELAAGVAHEINNPLTSIMGFTRLLLQEAGDDDPIKKDLQIIDREAARTRAIVRGLLDFARQREPRLEPADINEIVRTTMALVRYQAKSARVTIKESYEETLPLVSLDADQIKQVFLNMVTNAIQAMPEGGELEVRTAYLPQTQSPEPASSQARRGVKGRSPYGSTGSPKRPIEGRSPTLAKGMDGADCVVVEFHDTGTGISVENLPRIFDPFFTTKEVGQGTGLGLSISYSIVEKHGGKIEVESEVGRGSAFTVMLPVTGERGKG